MVCQSRPSLPETRPALAGSGNLHRQRRRAGQGRGRAGQDRECLADPRPFSAAGKAFFPERAGQGGKGMEGKTMVCTREIMVLETAPTPTPGLQQEKHFPGLTPNHFPGRNEPFPEINETFSSDK